MNLVAQRCTQTVTLECQINEPRRTTVHIDRDPGAKTAQGADNKVPSSTLWKPLDESSSTLAFHARVPREYKNTPTFVGVFL
jgi:hypothetical protein